VDEEPLEADRAAIRNRAARAIIPQSFIRMSELVVLHRDADRFDLLYRSLWRLVYEPGAASTTSATTTWRGCGRWRRPCAATSRR
jgi:DNA polymerase